MMLMMLRLWTDFPEGLMVVVKTLPAGELQFPVGLGIQALRGVVCVGC